MNDLHSLLEKLPPGTVIMRESDHWAVVDWWQIVKHSNLLTALKDYHASTLTARNSS